MSAEGYEANVYLHSVPACIGATLKITVVAIIMFVNGKTNGKKDREGFVMLFAKRNNGIFGYAFAIATKDKPIVLALLLLLAKMACSCTILLVPEHFT